MKSTRKIYQSDWCKALRKKRNWHPLLTSKSVPVFLCILYMLGFVYMLWCPSRCGGMHLFQHSATDNRAFAKVLSLFWNAMAWHRAQWRGRQELKSLEPALTSAHLWDLLLSSVTQYCKHDTPDYLKGHWASWINTLISQWRNPAPSQCLSNGRTCQVDWNEHLMLKDHINRLDTWRLRLLI